MLDFFTNHWVDVLAVITALFVVVDKVVKLTPTTADDELEAKVKGVLVQLGVLK